MCPECYSDNPRITPLLDPEYCLRNHVQYICSNCGRMICIDCAGKRRARCFMPFKSPDIAILYLRAAEVLSKSICSIFEIINSKSKRTYYKIYENNDELLKYIRKNAGLNCNINKPVVKSKTYKQPKSNQIKKLDNSEVLKYLKERNDIRK